MNWRKLGVIFVPNQNYDWMVSHAANPIPEWLEGDRFRIYFNSRDIHNRSYVGYVELDLNHPTQILALSPEPVLSPGQVGLYDDSGVSLGCIVPVNQQRYLYFVGWNLAVTVPWRNSIGLAIAPGHPHDAAFHKFGLTPILDRSDIDPYSLSYPWVLQEGDRYRMWYGSNLSWGQQHSDMLHVIKYAESTDGIHWNRQGQIALDLIAPEWGLARPCVIQDSDCYRMWYSRRIPGTYRLGYAESLDGLTWTRKDDQVGIDVSPSGWDDQSIEYAYVFDHAGQRFMVYNGNQYGKTGFGLAVWQS